MKGRALNNSFNVPIHELPQQADLSSSNGLMRQQKLTCVAANQHAWQQTNVWGTKGWALKRVKEAPRGSCQPLWLNAGPSSPCPIGNGLTCTAAT
eukprot:1149763-Pelagomonas_calceolata.AAC.4